MSKYRNDTAARHFVADADADPRAYDRYVRHLTGHPPAVVEGLLRIHRNLHHGEALTKDEVRFMQAAHPGTEPRAIAAICNDLNRQHPGRRADLFLAVLAGDEAAVAGRFNEAGDNYQQVRAIAKQFHAFEIADELNRRRDGGTLRADPEQRPVDPTSTRAIIEKQFEHPGMRAVVDGLEREDPTIVQATRHALADRWDAVSERLASGEGSLREALDDAWTSEAIEAEATDQGWIAPED